MIRLIILFILVYLLYKLVKELILKPGPNTHTIHDKHFDQRRLTDEMVQDPVCKVYVPKKDAITFSYAGKIYYCCSRECIKKLKEGKTTLR